MRRFGGVWGEVGRGGVFVLMGNTHNEGDVFDLPFCGNRNKEFG